MLVRFSESMSLLRSFLVALCLSTYSTVNAGSHVVRSSNAANESVSDILDKAIKALGGKDAFKSMKSVSSYAS